MSEDGTGLVFWFNRRETPMGILDRFRSRPEDAGGSDEAAGVDVVPGFVEGLASQDAEVRSDAAFQLGWAGDHRAVEPLGHALADSSEKVRRYAAESLGKIGDPDGVDPLIGALADAEAGVRCAAAEALGYFGSPAALDSLTPMLCDESSRVRADAATALGGIGDARAVPPLVQALRDSDSNVRRAAAKSLGIIGDASAANDLIALAQSDECKLGLELGAIASALVMIGRPAIESVARVKDDKSIASLAGDVLSRLGWGAGQDVELTSEPASDAQAPQPASASHTEWSPPTIASSDYERRCLEREYEDELDDRDFNSDPRLVECLRLLNSECWQEAAFLSRAIQVSFPDWDVPCVWLASSLVGRGRPRLAYKAAVKGVLSSRRKSTVLCAAADSAWRFGAIDEAVYAWAQSLHAQGNAISTADPLMFLGLVAREAGLENEAGAFLQKHDSLRSGTVRPEKWILEKLGEAVHARPLARVKGVLKKLARSYS